MATRDSLPLLPLFDHTHDSLTTGLVVASTGLLGAYASWLVADFGVRFPAFAVMALALGYLLYRQADRRGVLAGALYSLATLLLLTPFVYELAFVVEASRAGVGSPWAHVLSTADLRLFVLCCVLAAVTTLVAYRLTSGSFLARARARLGHAD